MSCQSSILRLMFNVVHAQHLMSVDTKACANEVHI